MPAFACPSCQVVMEFAVATTEPSLLSCPSCGVGLRPVEDTDAHRPDLLQAVIDQIIDQPGVRAFCTASSSVLLHLAAGCLLLLLVATGYSQCPDEVESLPSISSELIRSPNDAGTGFEFEGRASNDQHDAIKTAAAPIDKPVNTSSDTDAPLALDRSALSGVGFGEHSSTEVGAADSGSRNIYGAIGRGRSSGGGGRSGGGGSGVGLGHGNRPGGGEIFGVGGLPGAASIVYVVDRSGSMDTLGDFLKLELAKAVGQLSSRQSFNVIWFSEGDAFKLFNHLAPATEENKARLARHLTEVQFRGSTNPVSALTEALSAKPELVFVLTDGNFDAEFVTAIARKNAGRVRINVIGFVLGGEGHSNLETLARDNRGTFRAIDAGRLTGGQP